MSPHFRSRLAGCKEDAGPISRSAGYWVPGGEPNQRRHIRINPMQPRNSQKHWIIVQPHCPASVQQFQDVGHANFAVTVEVGRTLGRAGPPSGDQHQEIFERHHATAVEVRRALANVKDAIASLVALTVRDIAHVEAAVAVAVVVGQLAIVGNAVVVTIVLGEPLAGVDHPVAVAVEGGVVLLRQIANAIAVTIDRRRQIKHSSDPGIQAVAIIEQTAGHEFGALQIQAQTKSAVLERRQQESTFFDPLPRTVFFEDVDLG